jgi:hypothetical protein
VVLVMMLLLLLLLLLLELPVGLLLLLLLMDLLLVGKVGRCRQRRRIRGRVRVYVVRRVVGQAFHNLFLPIASLPSTKDHSSRSAKGFVC